ncbi:hypothetical protein [Mammaliicoccus vitulinus]|uniref:DUF2975 domain-containing protein n=1 Tax=Mammaliicoccus vitulinus TaxID=71237 RepID=A0A2T4PU00_9STAP|nr:hypothetical protein [Mammaliicoccus vitulinus]PTI29855.1 hypothetical protein BU072_06425 [Mammaliicoccus vitulinus]PTI68987.1 hypothetical protein BU073_12640 [Mammaliicoccus vitulinus]RIN17194.1 hypothetical protein BU075_02680 [Mammaliicoccus vitulinus]RIN18673.1 hypothetical protein BU070_12900 [Mammaliicoccus vitulinus]
MNNADRRSKGNYWFILVTMILNSALLVLNLVIFFKKVPINTVLDMKNGVFYYLLSFVLQSLLIIIFFIIVLRFFKVINKKDYFNPNNYNKIFFSSMLIIIYATLNSMKEFIGVDVSYKELLNTAPFTTILLLNIGLMMLNFLSIYNESEAIKEEHDLTI